MKIFKTLALALALVAGINTASADEGTHGIGVTFGYGVGSHDMNNLGLGIRYNYMLSDNLRIEPSFMYYFDTDDFREKDLSLNLHYLFNMSDDKLHFYPIFGVTSIFGKEVEKLAEGSKKEFETDSFFRLGCNLGAGLQYDLTDDFSLVAEAKYKLVKKFDNVHFAVGCIMTF